MNRWIQITDDHHKLIRSYTIRLRGYVILQCSYNYPFLFTDIISAGSGPQNDKADDAGTPKCSTVDDVYPLQESSQNGKNDFLLVYISGILMWNGVRVE